MREVKGCGMRSAVGFLSQRKINGHPLMKEEFQRRRLAGCTSLYKKDMLGHFGCVNAIEFSNNGGEWLVSGMGAFPSLNYLKTIILIFAVNVIISYCLNVMYCK